MVNNGSDINLFILCTFRKSFTTSFVRVSCSGSSSTALNGFCRQKPFKAVLELPEHNTLTKEVVKMIFLKKSNLTYLPPPPPGMFIAIRPGVFLYQFKHVVDCGITDSSAHGCLTPIHQARAQYHVGRFEQSHRRPRLSMWHATQYQYPFLPV